ncbi:MAG: matrixin family metalloprotease [Pseudobdellovibrionaceae bacterium]|nr:matrixin family metalloprotease [Pseudobdellovibrionaceae bacterium]
MTTHFSPNKHVQHPRKLWTYIASTLALLMFGCSDASKQGEDSSLKWSPLSPESSVLLTLVDGEKISICGNDAEIVAKVRWAIDVWSAPIGKKIAHEANCIHPKYIKVKLSSPECISGCTSGAAVSFGSFGDIELWTRRDSTILHEVGHIFGLNHSQSLMAVMYARSHAGNKNTTVLTPDDVDGIRGVYAQVSGRKPDQGAVAPKPVIPTPAAPTSPPPSDGQGNICKTDARVNQSLPVVFDVSCRLGGMNCVEGLPCRYQ